MDDPQYEQKYVAFVDIIGFRELISKLDVGKSHRGSRCNSTVLEELMPYSDRSKTPHYLD
jgi:hypothetical protein